jgi:hypothetical protein
MKHVERITSVAAALSALATLACCLPLGIVGVAAASTTLSIVLGWLRPWLLGLSVVLLVLGTHQVYRATEACQQRSRASVLVLWISLLVVLVVIVFPQLIASLLADWLP